MSPGPWTIEHVFDRFTGVDPHDIERLRRSVAMLPPDHTAGALTRSDAEALVEELGRLGRLTSRYREVIAELQRILDGMDPL